jgi:RNA polymerase sigma-70 factor (ECF subfamily)
MEETVSETVSDVVSREEFGRATLHAELMSYARRLTRNQSDAEDLVQDTVERGMRKTRLFKRGTSLRLWLCAIMQNLFLDQCRRKHPVIVRTPLDALPLPPDGDGRPVWWDVPDEAIARAFARLDERTRDLMTLHAVDGLSYGEIARRLRVPIPTVGTRLFRARQKLRELVFEAREGDEALG